MKLPSLANISFGHWAKKAKVVKQQRQVTTLAMRGRVNPSAAIELAPKRLVVGLTRASPKALDDDNLQSAFKHVRDAVAAYFRLDDADPRIRFEYSQEKAKLPCVRISFRIEVT